jgi:branched-chain amino acid aminotransferase
MTANLGWFFDEKQGARGTIIPEYHIMIPIDTHALHYGTLVFEGIKAYRAGAQAEARLGRGVPGRVIFRLDDHLVRFMESTDLYHMGNLPFTREVLREACVRVFAANRDDNYCRPIIFRGAGIMVNPLNSKICAAVITRQWPAYVDPKGVRVHLSGRRRGGRDREPHDLVDAKGAGNYPVSAVAKAEALARGFDEALLLAPDGRHLAEGSAMNLMLVEGNDLVMADRASCRLDGITQRTICELYAEDGSIRERPIRTDDLWRADEVFLVGTAAEVVPVLACDGRSVGRTRPGQIGPVTEALARRYREVVTGERIYRADWLTFVPDYTE